MSANTAPAHGHAQTQVNAMILIPLSGAISIIFTGPFL